MTTTHARTIDSGNAAERAAVVAEMMADRHQVGRTFVTAGNAIFTIENPQGQRFTFRVKCHLDENTTGPAVYFVGLLTGSENTSDYTYLGLLDYRTGAVRLTKKSRYTDDTLAVRVIRWALHQVWNGRDLPAGYSIHHAGRCGRCGRVLTVPSSILTGLGPECAQKM